MRYRPTLSKGCQQIPYRCPIFNPIPGRVSCASVATWGLCSPWPFGLSYMELTPLYPLQGSPAVPCSPGNMVPPPLSHLCWQVPSRANGKPCQRPYSSCRQWEGWEGWLVHWLAVTLWCLYLWCMLLWNFAGSGELPKEQLMNMQSSFPKVLVNVKVVSEIIALFWHDLGPSFQNSVEMSSMNESRNLVHKHVQFTALVFH